MVMNLKRRDRPHHRLGRRVPQAALGGASILSIAYVFPPNIVKQLSTCLPRFMRSDSKGRAVQRVIVCSHFDGWRGSNMCMHIYVSHRMPPQRLHRSRPWRCTAWIGVLPVVNNTRERFVPPAARIRHVHPSFKAPYSRSGIGICN